MTRLLTVDTNELVEKVCELIAYDLNVTCRMLSEEFNVSKNTIYHILTVKLNKIKMCARFVLHNLTNKKGETCGTFKT